ncbi:MAG: hypothetical protein IK079_04110, partial [Desulfovibrio sp.]|nr:hypothetical protein [Desulfovibrio sp.]
VKYALPFNVRVPLTSAVIAKLKFVELSLPSLWGEMLCTLQDESILARVIDGYIQEHLGVTWSKGAFRRV